MHKLRMLFSFIILIASIQINAQENTITIHVDQAKDTISKHIYGHFAEHLGRGIYDGFFVGKDSKIPNTNGIRTDIIEALRELSIPVLRWPGGCFAEQYQWKDGIGPVEERPLVVNTFWGGVTEDNSFGTHEFLELCEMLDTEPYIAVNIASGTVKDASQWIEYVTSDKDSEVTRLRKANGRKEPWDVKFWGIGNENWGCGGSMDAEYYTDVFKRFSTYCNADFKIASGGEWDDLEWTRTFMSEIKEVPGFIDIADGLSYHYYTIANDWSVKGSALDFVEEEWFRSMDQTLKMEANLEDHIAIMDEEDPDNTIALIADEWGTWYDVEEGTNPGFLYQQNSLRDALVAALGLNIFNNQARRVKMANIAQTVNVLQAMILTKEGQMVKTPTFYVFKMYKVHQDAMQLPSEVKAENYTTEQGEVPALSVSASKNSHGQVHVTVANVHPHKELNTAINLKGVEKFGEVSASIITADKMNAFNDFGKEEQVKLETYEGIRSKKGALSVDIPAKSVILLKIK
ncbi:alpha-N-arabinofuranosidase [Pseudozobellia sp. WGM2]|uniref:alpha-N-arabinofuranosidase n=1 Tax=Pseudozobellia sp. WGM2 TaxID=2787625 RepID=UPI001FD7B6C3|nr:alpha-L-arabinofuranosidase C-terminal domain-containing protein [Pseudozobellia sp. WGM2]